MKNIITLLILIAITISCKAQIIAVENFEDYPNELPDGAYIKDVNNVLGKYVGTWKGTYNNKNYDFKIVKYTENNIDLKYKEDMLLIRYKITDSSGTELANTLSLPNSSPYIIFGRYLAKSGGYVLNYQGLNAKCGQNGRIYISTYGANDTKLQLLLMVSGEIYDECTTGAVPQIMPTTSMELIKQ
ncbi:hypothetical protein WH52_13155 [Tenacibaculum holothuriorum]|uniref:DUF6705 domain-containing protein n=1 Tax=Tenacibaculum holothuriorum TaxID=1635173 RepID=A0A1Y2PAQ2_9FLAO|nr:DUF6705 family protein [Tenacibaculum holothuriorum]OSY87101.1 hypothetical protein WH52_13155 [Tenacibaculum holothuriorum]